MFPSSDVELEAMKIANATPGVSSVNDQMKSKHVGCGQSACLTGCGSGAGASQADVLYPPVSAPYPPVSGTVPPASAAACLALPQRSWSRPPCHRFRAAPPPSCCACERHDTRPVSVFRYARLIPSALLKTLLDKCSGRLCTRPLVSHGRACSSSLAGAGISCTAR